MDYIVNVEGTVDPETREVYWVHTTLDPQTMELPEDPMSGYLPAIDESGYQIGWVNFTINANEDLPDGTEFTNQAFVNFDGVGKWGPAPKEGPYTNIFDSTAPISEVLNLPSTCEIDSIKVSWTGEDAGSGIGNYTIYVSEGGDYTIWKENIVDTTAYFHGENGKTYRFYSIARDRVGNIEPGKDDYEAMITFNISNTPSMENLISIYPNPSECCFNVEIQDQTASSFKYEVYNSIGQLLITGSSPNTKWVIRMKGYRKGFYLVKVYLNDKEFSEKIILK